MRNPLLDPTARLVIGHRGAAAYAPENTIESFRLALAQGADALEMDVRRSADGVAMVFHDAALDRTTEASGPLARRSADQLERLDAGHRFTPDGTAHPHRGRGARIPTLREVLAAFPGVPILLEIKELEVAEPAAQAILEAAAAERVTVAGDDWRWLVRFREAPFQLGASRRDIARLYFGLGRPDPRCRNYSVPEAYHGLTIPSRRFVRRAHARDASVHVWTVDAADAALRWWRNGANGIVTNRPDLIAAVRGQVNG